MNTTQKFVYIVWIPLMVLSSALAVVYFMGETAGAASAAPPSPAPTPARVRPYLTEEIERMAARDHCVLRRQSCDERGVCVSCFGCGDGLKYLGTAETKCAGPSSCVRLETNEDWEREKVDLGWCERPSPEVSGPPAYDGGTEGGRP